MDFFAEYKEVKTYGKVYENEQGTSFCKARERIRKKYDICPFCQELVKRGSIILLLNNWKQFPNIIAHNSCCEKFSSKEDAIKFLHEDYQEALKYKQWFNKI